MHPATWWSTNGYTASAKHACGAKFYSIGRNLSHFFKAVIQHVWSRLLRVIIIIHSFNSCTSLLSFLASFIHWPKQVLLHMNVNAGLLFFPQCSFYHILWGVRHLCPTISCSSKTVAAVNCQLLLVMRQHICVSPAQLFCDWPVVLLQLQMTVISCFQSQFGEI